MIHECKIPGCINSYYAKGWCHPHYGKWRRYGDPLRQPPTKSALERFWSFVDTSSGPDSCWLWTGARSHGYGAFIDKVQYGAHRWAYLQFVGSIPEGLNVLHHCDNPACVNYTRCLFLGTTADNSADMVAKQRSAIGDKHGSRTHPFSVPRGERNGRAKLVDSQVQNIRLAYNSGDSLRQIARRYGVAKSTIAFIVNYQTWKEVA